MLCHECHLEIGDHERYVSFKIPGVTDWLYFHNRSHGCDCWETYLRRNPTIRVMEVSEQGLVQYKTNYYA